MKPYNFLKVLNQLGCVSINSVTLRRVENGRTILRAELARVGDEKPVVLLFNRGGDLITREGDKYD